jgi:hypothetical protein
MPEGQLENLAVTGAETGGGILDQGSQLPLARARVQVDRLVADRGGRFQRHGSSAEPEMAETLVAGDGVEPGAEPFGVPELIDSLRGHEQGVVEGIRGQVGVLEKGGAVTEEAAAVLIVCRRETLRITCANRLDNGRRVHRAYVNNALGTYPLVEVDKGSL